MVDAGVQIPLDAFEFGIGSSEFGIGVLRTRNSELLHCPVARQVVRPAVNGRDAGSSPAGTALTASEGVIDKNVLLGEQSVSKADGVGSNPTVLACSLFRARAMPRKRVTPLQGVRETGSTAL
jgi:hypothetical protein